VVVCANSDEFTSGEPGAQRVGRKGYQLLLPPVLQPLRANRPLTRFTNLHRSLLTGPCPLVLGLRFDTHRSGAGWHPWTSVSVSDGGTKLAVTSAGSATASAGGGGSWRTTNETAGRQRTTPGCYSNH